MTLAAGVMIGSYRIDAALGAGGMGEVWRAQDTRLGREVALKVLPEEFANDPDRMSRFEREARVLASLNHPNIAHLYGLETEAVTFLVMELAQGEDLSERISRGALPVDEAIPIALQIAEALEAAHEQGIVHRDLKPANIKLGGDGTVKVLDFGLAKAWESDGGADLSLSPTLTRHATAAGVILGTAAYMSPEQARGQAVDRRADIWAFGVVLWEMLTGRQLYQGETVSDVLASVLKEKPDLDALPADTPANVRRVVTRCLEKDPRQRLQWVGDARIELADVSDQGSGTEAIRGTGTGSAHSRRARLIGIAAVTAAIAAAVVAGFFLGHDSPAEPRVVRFDLAAPIGTSYHLDAASPGPMVVSPDGTTFAFSARSASGEIGMYLRELDAVEARALKGAEGAQYPFWSPDSTAIGFFADGKLKKIDAGGGPPITLCDAPNGKGGSWAPSGEIVFSPGPAEPLQRVSAAGGEPTQLTTIDESRGDNSHRHPRFLPDGKHFLYLARSDGDNGQTGHAVVVASLEGGPETVLLRSAAAAEFAAGRLLFVREQTLMSRPFDPNRLEFTGDAVPISQDVLVIPGAAIAVFTASSAGVLAYQPSAGGTGVLLTLLDREGNELSTLGEPAAYNEVWVSPDGTMAAVSLEDAGGGAGDIWIYEIERNVITRLTSDPGDEQQIVWSPDSRAIAFARRGGGSANIYSQTIDGTGPARLLLESQLDTFPTSWSPDGRLLGFDAESPDTGWDQWILPLDGGEPYPVLQTQFGEVNGVFSPDGRWLAFASDDSGRSEIYVTPFPGPGRRWRVSTEGGFFANWSSTGREIFFLSFSDDVMAVPVDPGEETITIGPPKVLIEANISPISYPYSPLPGAEQFLVITQQVGPQSLRVVVGWNGEIRR